MKSRVLAAAIILMFVAGACKKESTPGQTAAQPARKVLFELYSDHDLSTDDHNITFTLHMSRTWRYAYDSSLATMKIKDIPDFAHRISIEKTVPAYISRDIADSFAVSIRYTIQDVGDSWHLDVAHAGDTLKLVRFNFN